MLSAGSWRDVPGYEGLYSVSRHGLVFSHQNSRSLKGSTNRGGYIVVWLSGNGKARRQSIHRLVASAWIGPCPDGFHVDHIDGNAGNNRLENLRYLSPADNNRATVLRGAHAFGERNGQTKLTEDQVAAIREAKRTKGRYWGAREFAARLGISEVQVSRAAMGWTFKHADEPVPRFGLRPDLPRYRWDEQLRMPVGPVQDGEWARWEDVQRLVNFLTEGTK